MSDNGKRQVTTKQQRDDIITEGTPQETKPAEAASLPAHGVVYSKRLNLCPFTIHPLKDYALLLGDERMERLLRVLASILIEALP